MREPQRQMEVNARNTQGLVSGLVTVFRELYCIIYLGSFQPGSGDVEKEPEQPRGNPLLPFPAL